MTTDPSVRMTALAKCEPSAFTFGEHKMRRVRKQMIDLQKSQQNQWSESGANCKLDWASEL